MPPEVAGLPAAENLECRGEEFDLCHQLDGHYPSIVKFMAQIQEIESKGSLELSWPLNSSSVLLSQKKVSRHWMGFHGDLPETASGLLSSEMWTNPSA